jgi:hypothetical protein
MFGGKIHVFGKKAPKVVLGQDDEFVKNRPRN